MTGPDTSPPPHYSQDTNSAIKTTLPPATKTSARQSASGHEQKTSTKKHWALTVGGMWGGLHALRRSQSYIQAQIGATRFTQENLAAMQRKLDPTRPTVAVHLRAGDFSDDTPIEEIQGKFNVRLPYEWYESALAASVQTLGNDCNVVILGNDSSPHAKELTARFDAIDTKDQSNTDMSDLLLLSQADLLIPSISSFSILALFLNPELHYLWPREHLSPVELEGSRHLAIWPFEPEQRAEASPTRNCAREAGAELRGRCVAIAIGDTALPPLQAGRIRDRAESRLRCQDLIRYGSIPARQPHH